MADKALIKDGERAVILAIQTALGESKEPLRTAMAGLSSLMKQYKDSGNVEAYNAAYRARGALRVVLGSLEVAHADASADLERLFSDAGPVVFGGGGGRG